ncbi:MAG: right-handed parallel beta-helix repeat-containing protein, partial [Candidatus Omnitrophica bacterium]|nr:right-handed parallel beta-helix repeat-containing protein [Candidatus Omnitrophota bacterium]
MPAYAGRSKLGKTQPEQHQIFGDLSVGNVLTVSQVNKVIVIDSIKYARTSAGINAAIGDLPATGGVVFLPEATYTITAPIMLNATYVVLRGTGASTILSVSGGGINALELTADSTGVMNLSITGATVSGIDVNAANNCLIQSVGIDASTGDGISIANSSGGTISLCSITNNGAYGIDLAASVASYLIAANIIDNNTSGDIRDQGTTNTVVLHKTGGVRIGTGVNVSNDFTGSGDLFVTNDMEISGNLSVGSDTTIGGVIFSKTALQASGDLTIEGRLYVDEIEDEADSQIVIKSPVIMESELTVSGNVTLSSELSVGDLLIRADTGNVGINTKNPTQKLEVDGNAYITGNTYVGDTDSYFDTNGNLIEPDNDILQWGGDEAATYDGVDFTLSDGLSITDD